MKNETTNSSNLLFALLLIFSVNSFAQESLNDTLKLNEIVVTGTKTSRSLRDVPASISVVNAQMISQIPNQQVDDLLGYAAGVNINRSGGIYSQRPMVTLRGTSGNEQSRTLVLLNGVPINTSDEGGVNWNRINTYDLESIEILRGPGSSLYGGNAMGGVISINSRKARKPQEIYGGVSYGTYNTLRQDLGLYVRNEKGYYASLSQYYLQSAGYNTVPDSLRSPYDVPVKLEEIGLSARAGNDQNQWLNWELQYDVYRDERGEGFQVYSPKGCYRNFNTNLFRGNLKGGNNTTQYNLNLYYQLEHYYDVNERMRGTSFSRYDVNAFREDLGALFNINHQLTRENTLTAGMEYKQGSIKGGDYYQTPRRVNDSTQVYDTIYNAGTLRTIAGYIQDEHALFDNKVRLVAGLRFDRVTVTDGEYTSTDPWNTIPELKDHTWSELSPRLGIRFNPIDEISTYISYSHGFRASILDDLTRTGWMWVGPKIANPNLGPESVNNYELGITTYPISNMRFGATVYTALGDDFLYYISTGDSLFGRPVFVRENVTSVSMNGLELDFRYDFEGMLTLLASYAYNDSKIDGFTEQPELEGKYLAYVPQHSGSVSGLFHYHFISASLMAKYKGKQFSNDANTNSIDPYTTIDCQLALTLMESMVLSIEVQDIFDNEHLISDTAISPGRTITGRVALKF